MNIKEKLSDFHPWVKHCIDDGSFTGTAIGIYHKGNEGFLYAGDHPIKEAFSDGEERRCIDKNSLFDIGSITHVVGPVTLILSFADQGVIDLQDPVKKYLPNYRGKYKDAVTIWDLLTRAVKPAHQIYTKTRTGGITGAEIMKEILEGDLACPPGTVYDENNSSKIVLGLIAEKLSYLSLPEAIESMVTTKFHMPSTTFFPKPVHIVVPTEASSWRGKDHLQGQVHDEMTFILDRDLNKKTGAAGMFSTAPDLLEFGKALLQPNMLLKAETLHRLFTEKRELQPGFGGSFSKIGWNELPPSYLGNAYSENTICMTGFRSTMIAINFEEQFVFVALCNALYNGRDTKLSDAELSVRGIRKRIIRTFLPYKH